MKDGSTTADRLYYGSVCSRRDLIEDHIKRHELGVDELEYLRIANTALNETSNVGKIHTVAYNDKVYRVVLDGLIRSEKRDYRVVRSVVYIGSVSDLHPYQDYEISVKVVKGSKYIKPNLPEWTLSTVQSAIEDIEFSGMPKVTLKSNWPIPHIVRVRKKIKINVKFA